MHITIGAWKPISCSKCGSFKAVKPLNECGVDICCLDCGHQKLAPTPPTNEYSSSWTIPKKRDGDYKF